MDSNHHTKKARRNTAQRQRNEIAADERMKNSEAIQRHILQSDIYRHAKSVMCYVSYRSEVSTHTLLQAMIADGKEVYIPSIERGDAEMMVSKLRDFQDLTPDYMGILSLPRSSAEAETPRIDLILIPGLLFDDRGYRLGYGGGFYDRFLEKQPKLGKGTWLGLGFELQMHQEVPIENHDIALDGWVSERGLMHLG